MSSNRIYDLARQLNVPSRDLLDVLKNQGIDVKSHMSTVDDATANIILEKFQKKPKGESQKNEGKSFQEKKIGTRTYIPPRKRQRGKPERPRMPERFQYQGERQQREEDIEIKKSQAQLEYQKTSGFAKKTEAFRSEERFDRGQRPEVAPRDRRQRPEVAPRDRGQRPEVAPRDRGQRPGIPQKQERGPSQEFVSSRGKPQRYRYEERKSEKSVEKGLPVSLYNESEGRIGGEVAKRREGPHHNRKARGGHEQEKKRDRYTGDDLESQDRIDKGFTKRPGKGERIPIKRKDTPIKRKETPIKRKESDSHAEELVLRTQVKKEKKKPAQPLAQPPIKLPIPEPEEPKGPKRLEIPEVIMVKDLAEMMDVPPAKIIRHLMTMGFMPNVNQVLETKAAMSIAQELGFEAIAVTVEEKAELQEESIDVSKLKPRPPVVTIMGHVDHGKTTLLDAIRESKITDTEFGGITQHIGAYTVEIRGQKIVFLDTPGHEAFTAMRARGAKVTDEVILVVAADDGIMPQTIEAIDHARAAHVPIIVAINKIDIPGANPDRVMQEMTKYGLTPEEWGGDTICVKVSAKMRTNLDDLLEMILLQAEMLELKADPDRSAKGVIVEALLDKGRGPVATVLIQRGTLHIGDSFVTGVHYGRVRAMLDDRGKRVKEAGPATPVEVLGLTGVPTAGDSFIVVEGEREARLIAESRQEQQQKVELSKTSKITLEELHHHIKEGETQEFRIVIKADVHGSVEALSDALERLSTEKVRLQVIHGGVGAINESDVMLAAASNAIVLGFNIRPVAKARDLAEKEQIDVRLYNVIYQAIDDVKKGMEGLLQPVLKEVLIGQAQVLALFSLPKGGTVAGCRVTNGKITRNSIVRVMRDNKEMFKGNIASLRRIKEDVREVLSGYECGIRLENYNDIRENDVIEAYTIEKMAMSLDGTVAKQGEGRT
ncbi:MAG: translation initiation factor IF-2 [Candidatus Vecturithrix sp.]|jgi:translation initiation factor IF-2|nr:translation initiation factor IF-2 [Candidatus Vecturithrix sp.]